MTYCPSKETFLLPPASIHDEPKKKTMHRAESSNMEAPNPSTGCDVMVLHSSPHSTHWETGRKDAPSSGAPWSLRPEVSKSQMTERGSKRPDDSVQDDDLELNSLLLSLQIFSRTCDNMNKSGNSNGGSAKNRNSRSVISGKSCSADSSYHRRDSRDKEEGLVTPSYNRICKVLPDTCGSSLNNNNSVHGICQNSSCFRLLCHHPGSVSRTGQVADMMSEPGSCHPDVRKASTVPYYGNATSHHSHTTTDALGVSSGSCRFSPSFAEHDLCPCSRNVTATKISPRLDFAPNQESESSKTGGDQPKYGYGGKSDVSMRISNTMGRCCGQEEVTYDMSEEGSLKLFQADILTVLTSSLCDDLKIDALAGKDGVGVTDDVEKDTNSSTWDSEVTKSRMGRKHDKSLGGESEIGTTNPGPTTRDEISTVPGGPFETKPCNEERPREKRKTRKLKPSYQRSKSLHREQSQEKPEGDKWDGSNLNGSLRELAHLNIDVCQQLVDGQRVFTVKDASPELQVVVNSLTPVLSRRSRSRRSGHYEHASETMSSSVTSESESLKVCHASPRSTRDDSTDKSVNVSADELSHETSTVSSSIKASYHLNDPMGDARNLVLPVRPVGKTQNHPALVNLFDRSASRNVCVKDDISIERDDLALELEENKHSLFMSPKLSRTWHGVSDFTRYRTGPKMGVGLMLSGKDSHGSTGQPPLSTRKSADKNRVSATSPQHAQTLPIISRTLLDAMHKRYCAHQYSNNYQTLQPFTMLKIDPASSTGNQPITALRVEPCSVRDHEVHVAPPSPQFIARLRQLNSEFKANRFAGAQFTPAPRSLQQMPKQLPAPQQSLRPQTPPQRPSPEIPLRQTGVQLVRLSHQQTAGPHLAHLSIIPQCEGSRAMGFPGEVSAPVVSSITEVSSSGHAPDKRLQHSCRPAELEAIESLKWLRAAGFPQYAQMFEDGQFPVELSVVERDHDFLDADSLKSLFRRLETLNKFAGMKIHSQHRKKGVSEEDDEEEDLCALSERWEYQKSARRWSRKEPQTPRESDRKPLDKRAGSHDSLLADQDSGSQTGDSPLMDSKLPHEQDPAVLPQGEHPYGGGHAAISAQPSSSRKDVAAQVVVPPSFSPPLRRSASEKVKPTRTLWKGMKSKKRSGASRGIVEISNPVVADKENMQAKLVKFNCRDISPTSDSAAALPRPGSVGAVSPTSPQSAPPMATHTSSFESPFGSRKAFASQSLRVQPTTQADQTDSARAANDSNLHGFYTAHSKLLQSLESAQQKETGVVKQNRSDNNLKEIFILPEGHQPGRFPTILQNGYIETKSTPPPAPGTETLSDIPLHTDGATAITFPPATHVPGQRFSFYDNWLPAEHNRTDHSGSQNEAPHVPSGSSHSTTGHESNKAVSFDAHKLDSIRESRSSSVLSTSGSQSDSDSRKLSDSGLYASFSTRAKSDLRTPSRESSAEPSSLGGRITQSPSVQSGELTETSSMHSSLITSSTEAGEGASSDLKLDYQEFDLILQQLYDKIQDLNNYVTKEEKGNPTAQTSLQHPRQNVQRSLSVDMSRSQPTTLELDSPVSPTSDLVVSPSSPMSTGGLDGTESVEDNSTSGSSAGESSHSGSDQEVGLTDLSHDDSLDQITHVSMERRDSGVGHSLTRASGDRRRKKLRWNSFQKCHRPDVTCRAMQINSLTVSQLVRLQKLSLLKLTSIMEKYMPANKSGWNWMMAKLMKKKPPDFSDKNVFGVPFTVTAQRTGQPLPQCVLYAMRYLRRTSQNAVGIFRKSGVKSKIQQLRDHLEAHPETSDFEDANAYNVADMLKTYFRDLPECLLTNKMSETFRSIYTYVPQSQRLEALQAAILLLPDENREVLQSILLFLSDISAHEADHQMNASNLAVCFTPTVFQLGTRYMGSPKRNRKNSPGIPDPREILEQKAAHECLLMMISECKKLFTIPPNIFRQLQGTSLAHLEPASLQDIGNSPAEVKAFGQERIQMVLKEAHDKNRGWIPSMSINDVEIFHRKPMDDCPLKEWKLVVDIEAPPIEVLRRIMHERHSWDEDLLSWSVLERLDPHSDIFQYVLSSMAPHPSRHYCVLRYWRSDLTKGACALVTMSVEHSENMDIQGVWAIDLGSFILMEPCGSGRSRVTYITRVDTRGRSPEWYSKIFGHTCANFLERLQESFKQESSGPETKV